MPNFYKPKKKSDLIGKKCNVVIEQLDINCDGVARVDGKPLFVPFALPGEKVLVKISEQKSKYARATLLNVIESSKQRVDATCQHYQHCGGCQLQHLSEHEQLVVKKQKVSQLFQRNADIADLPWQSPIQSRAWHYRRKARLGVQYNKKNGAVVGFRRASTNVLMPIKECPILFGVEKGYLSSLSQLVNNELRHNLIGHIDLILLDSCCPIVTFRVLKTLTDGEINAIRAWSEGNLSIVYSQNNQGDIQDLFAQNALLEYEIDTNVRIRFSPKDFIQVNAQVNESMVQLALSWLACDKSDHVLDLFSGLGNFSLPLAKRVSQVYGVEGVDSMVNKAAFNAKLNGIENCSFFQADLNDKWPSLPWNSEKINKALIDPARAGAFEAIKQLLGLAPAVVVYVSCDPATLARDAKVMVDAGYKIEKIALVDMFSQTKHIETMVLFSR